MKTSPPSGGRTPFSERRSDGKTTEAPGRGAGSRRGAPRRPYLNFLRAKATNWEKKKEWIDPATERQGEAERANDIGRVENGTGKWSELRCFVWEYIRKE
ncbi:hypothetical protein CEXT_56811 [Caerostris extrusa]|uniref:Uncharacterized protein n=1 Tax=Caerostris extrusa TaxID=172846 RepID=A0AAV4TQI2_CAEEX|nr:hypothetical protein CEXT_56811 [Caerostris extrusa]